MFGNQLRVPVSPPRAEEGDESGEEDKGPVEAGRQGRVTQI